VRGQRSGPRRASSVKAYLRQTRIMAFLALLALVAGVISDLKNERFWERHALLSGLASSMIVVILTAAVINEILEIRRRQRWSVLAQFVMFELVRNARMIWTGVLDVAGLLPPDTGQEDFLDSARQVVRDTAQLTTAVRKVIDDQSLFDRLHSEIAFLSEHSNEVISRWAGVMLNVEVYAEVMDRHVELAGDISWIGALLDGSYPPDDVRRQRRARSSPAVQIESKRGGGWMADRMVVIVQLAEALDSGTLEIALKIVPVEWWEERLGTSPQAVPGSDQVARRS
jgi:hypothetical protein